MVIIYNGQNSPGVITMPGDTGWPVDTPHIDRGYRGGRRNPVTHRKVSFI